MFFDPPPIVQEVSLKQYKQNFITVLNERIKARRMIGKNLMPQEERFMNYLFDTKPLRGDFFISVMLMIFMEKGVVTFDANLLLENMKQIISENVRLSDITETLDLAIKKGVFLGTSYNGFYFIKRNSEHEKNFSKAFFF